MGHKFFYLSFVPIPVCIEVSLPWLHEFVPQSNQQKKSFQSPDAPPAFFILSKERTTNHQDRVFINTNRKLNH
jgi:hypothetical protein